LDDERILKLNNTTHKKRVTISDYSYLRGAYRKNIEPIGCRIATISFNYHKIIWYHLYLNVVYRYGIMLSNTEFLAALIFLENRNTEV